MYSKSVLLFIVHAYLIQIISSQYIGAYETARAGPWTGSQFAYGAGPCAAEYIGYLPGALAASNGGSFAVTSGSPIAPTGVFVTSDNAYEGGVSVAGRLPFLSAVALEGYLPTAGAGAIAYGCGTGNVAILSEDLAPAYGPAPLGFGVDPYGYGPGPGYPGYGYLY